MNLIKRYFKRIALRIKWRKKNVHFGTKTQIEYTADFGGYNHIGSNSFFSGKIGYASYIGENCHIVADIGKYCCIASRVVTVRGSHPTRQWASIHPAFYSTKLQCGLTYVSKEKYAENREKIIIGNDVWIGDSAILLDGITIGDGAVVAAGAVVTKDVEPYSIVGGVPAKIIRYRFDDKNQIKQLLKIRWWEKSENLLRKNSAVFENIDLFLDKFKEE